MGNCGSDMFGAAADDLLAYQTLKVVRIKDHRLGFIYYGLIMLIIVFIFGYEMLYCNNHFDKRDVFGTPRIALRQPTINLCDPHDPGCQGNFSSLQDLPYCSSYRGNSTEVHPDAREDCRIADRYSLLPNGVSGNTVLIPTRIAATRETPSCNPGPGNNWTCGREYSREPPHVQFVADIERYSILLSHSYHRDTFSGNNNRVMGYYSECDTTGLSKKEERWQRALFGASECMGTVRRLPIECLDGQCHFQEPFDSLAAEPRGRSPGDSLSALQGRGGAGSRRLGGGKSSGTSKRLAASEEFTDDQAPGVPNARGRRPRRPRFDMGFVDDGVFAVPEGDVFSLGKLLSLAGVDSLDTATNRDGRPLRKVGTVINIDVRYSNLVPFASTFGHGEVTYEYHISLNPMHQVQDELVVGDMLGQAGRTIEQRNGVLIVVTVEGSLGFFSIVNLLLMLAEAASMLAVATILTDKIAIYFMERAPIYYGSKYEEPRIGEA